MRDRTACLLLLVLCVIVRLPFLRVFDLVTYDGTYYINQAKSMFGAAPAGGAFPIGYPVFIALVLPVVRDGVRAAQLVSLLAGLGSVWLVYALGKTIVSRRSAFIAAALVAVTPLFVRLSLSTLSESLFIFWVLLGLYVFARGKDLVFGLVMGLAAVTRPEAVGIFAVLLFWRKRSWKRLAGPLIGFAVLFATNALILSVTTHRFVLLPKTEFFGTSAARWQAREAWVDFSGREDYEHALETGHGINLLLDATRRFPKELLLLGRHVMPVALALALYGLFSRRLFILAGLVPFLFYPFFTTRSEPRYVLPYVPFVILYAVVGLERFRSRRARMLGIALLVVSTAAGLVVNKSELVTPVSDGYQWAKKAGLEWRERIRPGDRVADRKPFFAFYAEAAYVPIPIAPYDDVMNYLVREKVRFLMLHRGTIETLRPALMPLLDDPALIRGELRYRQIEVEPGVYALYETTGMADPLVRKRITRPTGGLVVYPCWSPDGAWIAYRALGPAGSAGVYVVPAAGGEPRRVMAGSQSNDPLAWSPDSKRIALVEPSENGGPGICVIDVSTGKSERLTTGGVSDHAPSWTRDGREIVFSSSRTGRDEIWSKDIATGRETQITSDGGNAFPAVSPGGDRVACIDVRGGLVILDRVTGRKTCSKLPGKASFVPSWSPDDRFIAVTAQSDGGVQVYILRPEGGETLLLTRTTAGNGMPCWSPNRTGMVVVMNEGGDYGLWVLTGLGPYLDRLALDFPVQVVGPAR